MIPDNIEVLIIGAGPTGLTAAIALASQGRDVVIIDSQEHTQHTSRAAVVHSHTLEKLEPYGVSSKLAELGIHTPRFTIRDRDTLLLPVDFDDLPTKYPYTLMISQATTEAVLLEQLHALGGQVLRPYSLAKLEQTSDDVVATMTSGEQIRASFVIGADGMHSTVREQAGVGFTGGTYDESFVLADVRLEGGVPQNEVILYFSPAGLVVVAPLPDGSYRIVATVDQAPEHPNREFVQELLDSRGPQAQPAIITDTIWSSRFRVHHRIADNYRAGRIFLAGDAAHVHSPAGGQGMNAGITDAIALAELMGQALEHNAPALMDAYNTTRRPVAENVLTLAGRLTKLATASPAMRPFRNLMLRALAKVPSARKRLAWQLSGLVYR
ncbi:MAG: FAD-dependent oxidoreductase [Corynebacteriales bacterium]|nr:FAD-dependent oxidoreductase [Mycobacteriales bacterium]